MMTTMNQSDDLLTQAAKDDEAALVLADYHEERGETLEATALRKYGPLAAKELLGERETTRRLAACAAVKKRFAGRAQLTRLAKQSQLELARLEERLGLRSKESLEDVELIHIGRADLVQLSPEERRTMVLREYARVDEADASSFAAAEILVQPEINAIFLKRRSRETSRDFADPLDRSTGHAERVIAYRVAERVIGNAGFRVAKHGHQTMIGIVDEGREYASSETGNARPQEVGLPNAYVSKGFWVTTSEHMWQVSRLILTAEVKALNASTPSGVVYLSTTKRVKQGRGTALVVQTRTERGAWR